MDQASEPVNDWDWLNHVRPQDRRVVSGYAFRYSISLHEAVVLWNSFTLTERQAIRDLIHTENEDRRERAERREQRL